MDVSRQEERKKVAKPLYVLREERGNFMAVSVDVSDCGICLVTNQRLRPGQTVKLYSEDLWPVPVSARTVWMSHLECETNRVGLVICDVSDN